MGNSNIKGETSMRRFALTLCAICAALLIHSHVFAQQPAAPPLPPAYGPPISLEMAKKAMAAAEAEAVKNNWDMVITILDSGGNLVMTHKMDNAPLGSIAISRGKARTAVEFKRPSKAVEDGIAAGGAGLRLLSVRSSGVFVEGGVPIVVDGKIVGSIGTSGGTSGRTHRSLKRAQTQRSDAGRPACLAEMNRVESERVDTVVYAPLSCV